MYQSALNDVDRLTRKVNALQDRVERLSFARREMFDRLLKKNRELRELEKQVYGHARIIPHSPVCDSNVDEKIAEINERLAKLEGLR
jgi:chromosome segregation ATPase